MRLDSPQLSGRQVVCVALCTALIFSSATLASSRSPPETWPARPIKLLVPAAAGSTSDIVSRVIAVELGKSLGQPVVVIDRPGAGGTIATAELAHARPDGYTIGFATQGTLVIDQALYSAPGYDSLADFAPIAFIGGVSNILIVNPSNPATRVQELVEAARSHPGELTFSSGGNGSSHHLAGVLFGTMTGTRLVHVPYQAPMPAVQAIISGEVTMGLFNASTVMESIRAGQVKALGVTSLTRAPLLPNVPTLDEEGIHGYHVSTWFGLIAPAATPAEIVARLGAEVNRIVGRQEIRQHWMAQGFDVATPMSA
jgi:tripartite-type tricarboxylate transporter receptor subunit TctC